MAMGDEMGLFILLPMRSLAEKFVKRFAVRNADVAKKTAGKGSARRWLPSAMLKAASLGGGLKRGLWRMGYMGFKEKCTCFWLSLCVDYEAVILIGEHFKSLLLIPKENM